MIAADILKLRRHRSTMATAALLSAGMAIIYFAFIEARHHGNLAGPQALSDGATLMGIYHSHPNGGGAPSARDIAEAYYPDVAYVIATVHEAGGGSAKVRAFSIRDGAAREIPVEVAGGGAPSPKSSKRSR